jgi:hypothetical protein
MGRTMDLTAPDLKAPDLRAPDLTAADARVCQAACYIQSAWRGQASRVSTTSGGPSALPGSVAAYLPR